MSRVFGDTNITTDKVGELTQGLGFEQLDVQDTPVPNPTLVRYTELGTFETITQQDPTGLGDAGKIIVNYGVGGNTSGGEFTVNANGIINTNPASLGIQYRMQAVLRIGRTGAAMVSIPLIRFMYAADGIQGNAVQVGGTFAVEIDNANTVWRENFDLNFGPAIGSLFFIEFARDEAGNDSGSLQAPQPTGTLAAWSPVNVARITFVRRDSV
jgi:hypothetical protein